MMHGNMDQKKYSNTVTEYERLFKDTESSEERKEKYMTVVNSYYDLVTDFYEWGWSQSFHFARMYPGEKFLASLARHEHVLAAKLQLRPGQRVLDVGAGVGGPMREIARFSGASVIGINNNQYQVDRGTLRNLKDHLNDLCAFVVGDFMNIPVPDGSMDAAYTIEACVHAPDRVLPFKQVYNKLKPGALFAGYEWCMTDKHDQSNPLHREWKHDICTGDGLPDIQTVDEVVRALKLAGFEVLEINDYAPVTKHNSVPWYHPLLSFWFKPWTWHLSPVGAQLQTLLIRVAELFCIAPRGTWRTQAVLMAALRGLVAAGKAETFTPMLFFLVRKPLHATATHQAASPRAASPKGRGRSPAGRGRSPARK